MQYPDELMPGGLAVSDGEPTEPVTLPVPNGAAHEYPDVCIGCTLAAILEEMRKLNARVDAAEAGARQLAETAGALAPLAEQIVGGLLSGPLGKLIRL